MLTFPLLRRICISSSVLYIINQYNPHAMRTWHWNVACPKMACSSARGSWGQSWWRAVRICFYQGWSTFNVESTCQRRCQGSLLGFLSRCRNITIDSDHLELRLWSGLPHQIDPGCSKHMPPMIKATDKRATLHHLKSDCLLSCPTKIYNNICSPETCEFFFGCVPHFSSEAPFQDGGSR